MPNNVQNKIQKAVLSVRKDYLKNTIEFEKKLKLVYQKASDELEILMLKKLEMGKLGQIKRLKAIKKETKAILDNLKIVAVSDIKKGIRQSVNLGMKSQVDGVLAVFKDKGIGAWKAEVDYGSALWTKINTDAVDFLLKYPTDGIPLSRHIWRYHDTAYTRITQDISIGMIQGQSSSTIARRIKNRLIFPERDLRLKWVKAIHPGRGVYRSAYKNSLRVARTEMNRAYLEGQSRYMANKNWIKGSIRREPGSADDFDCADAKDQFYKKGYELGLFHPHCMGYNEPVLDEVKLGIA